MKNRSWKYGIFFTALWVMMSVMLGDAQAAPRKFQRCGNKPVSPELIKKVNQRLQAQAQLDRQNPSAMAAVRRVSIFYHIIQDSNGDNPVTESDLQAQTAAMNSAYKKSNVVFSTAGFDTTVNDAWFTDITPDSTEESDMKSSLYVGDMRTLNVYLAQPGQDLLGWATFPSDQAGDQDGVVMLYSTVPGGAATGYNRGATLIHEGGHWMGLFHTFQPSGNSNNGCIGSGDGVSDTPAEKIAHYECRVSDSCPKSPGKDPIHDYMDYTPDACMNTFTAGQATRMARSYDAYRKNG